ncbi:MAG: TatD family hydrolase, partial [Clostridia bacterium]|nr:TatD family hydrolase [Clostridia bacterium]
LKHRVTHIINAGTDVATSKQCVDMAAQYPFVYAAVGVHPHEASASGENALEELIELSKAPKVVAWGEIGLDFHYDFSPRETQRDWFARQIAIARSLKLPLILHDRESHREVLDIVRAEKGYEVGGVFHCFSGSKEMAKEVLDMGFHIGIGGAMTFKNAHKPVEVVRYMPLDRLLVETDCPYMTPEPFRGTRNWSGLIKYVLEKISEIKEISYNAAEEATSANAIRLFKL